ARRHVEEPPLDPLEAALDSRPRLEPRGIEAVGWHELDGEAHAAGNLDRLLVDLARGGPRHASNANPAAGTGQRMGEECTLPPASDVRGVRCGSGGAGAATPQLPREPAAAGGRRYYESRVERGRGADPA